MPILNVDKSRSVIVLKRSMNSGFAGIHDALFYADGTTMLFGDAKKSVSEVSRSSKRFNGGSFGIMHQRVAAEEHRRPTAAGEVKRARRAMQARLQSLVLRPTPPPIAFGLVIAASLIVAETVVLYPLKHIAPVTDLAAVYLVGVVVASIVWGFWMAAATSVTSAVAFDYFHIPPAFGFTPTRPEDGVALGVFGVVALLTSTLADLARSRAAEAGQRRLDADVLAKQQEALRRVATLVARGVAESEVFSAVAVELAGCLGMHYAILGRYEPDGACMVLAARNDPGVTTMPVGERFSLDGQTVSAIVFRTRRPARVDYENVAGSDAARVRELGLRHSVGAPIVVDGRVWGAAVVGSAGSEALPPDSEGRVAAFTELVATAIANAEAHRELTASRVRIVAAADDARRRLERDLHDGAQQRLVSLGLALRAAEASVPSDLPALKAQSLTSLPLWPVSTRSCRKSRGAFTRRSCPGADSAQPSRAWPAVPPSPSSFTSG